MSAWMEFAGAAILFLTGLRFSAFFSGSETGFYRLSHPRLAIDARTGDRVAQRLLWFSENPAYFVATCLVGNNIANYLVTAAISWGGVLAFGSGRESVEIALTLLLAPVIFLIGELLPKNVYYRAPLHFLKKETRWFQLIYWMLWPVTSLLVTMTTLMEWLVGQSEQSIDTVLGRNRLAQLLQHGHREGVLTDMQTRLASGLLRVAPEPVTKSIVPRQRIIGMSDAASREDLLQEARAYGVSVLAIRRGDDPEGWYGYVRVREVLAGTAGSPTIHVMPKVSHKLSKLETLNLLQMSNAPYAAVFEGERILGIASRIGLIEQIFRASTPHPMR